MFIARSFLATSILALGALAQPNSHRALINRAATATSASIPKATAWDPPADMVEALDQLISNNGSIHYCVRWNTALTSTASNRTKTEAALQRSLNSSVDTLVGFEGFPLTEADVKVVGYAVKDESLLEGDTSSLDVYTTADADGVPGCDVRCYCGAHLEDPDYLDSCPGGEDSRYDISLWLDDSLTDVGGYGYDWGEELPPSYFFETIDDENVHVLLHETGHGFGLLDFYDWQPEGQDSFVMMAGSAFEVTGFDAWMLRDWYRKLKVERGW